MLSLKEEKPFGVFYGLVATLSLVWRHGMSSITYDDRPAFDVGWERILIAKLPKSDVLGLSSERNMSAGRSRVTKTTADLLENA